MGNFVTKDTKGFTKGTMGSAPDSNVFVLFVNPFVLFVMNLPPSSPASPG